MTTASIDFLHPVFVLGLLGVALLTGAAMARVFGAPSESGRFASVDGLRGFLALGVFIQHAAIWYHYSRTGAWDLPPSHLFRHLGQTSVGLFFMITALLFTRKVMQRREQPMDWTGLFVGRALRLWPLYLVVVGAALLVVLVAGGPHLKEPVGALLSHLFSWVMFTFNGNPDVNAFANTSKIVAGVTWTLPYEWLFYIALPLLAVPLRGERNKWLLAASLAGCLVLAHEIPKFHLTKLAFFAGGMAAAFCVEIEAIARRLRGVAGSVLTLGSLAAVLVFFDTAYRLPVAALLTLAFIPLVCGNTLFGLLVRPTTRTLGELTYGLYLWHGIVLYLLYRHALPDVTTLTPVQHWLVAAAITPFLLLLCYVTYRFVERPGIEAAPRLATWLKARRRNRSVAAAA
jgi:peptidoglycan/LPS O-acetylase OafA/YrhL